MHRSTLTCSAAGHAVLALCLTLAIAPVALAEDWPQFRGQARDGISAETGLIDSWPEKGPKEVWRVPIGEGYSGLAVVGKRLYTMFAGELEGQPTEFAAAYDATNGKELWRVPIGEKFDNQFGNGPRATPTVVGDTMFVMGSRGDVYALATADGTERWKVSLTETFGSQVPTFGFSASALVDDDIVFVEGGGAEGKAFAGLDRKTGKTKWTFGDAQGQPGYNSAIAVDMDGKRRWILFGPGNLMAMDSAGKEIWSMDWPRGETHASPVFVAPDRIFASGAEGVGATFVRIKQAGGKAEIEELWKSDFMRNHFSSSVVHGDHIYGFDNATLKCIRISDGSMAWAKRGLGKGSLILGDGHLYVLSDRGKLLLVEANPEKYVEKGSVEALEDRCWTSPTLAGGHLFLRNHTDLVAYDVKD